MFSATTYQARRAALRERVKEGLIVMHGNHDSPMNYRDNVYPFRQDSSFLYFFGLNQAGLVGVMDVERGEDWLLGEEASLEDLIWSGARPTLAQCAQLCGITRTGSRRDLHRTVTAAAASGRTVHYLRPYRADIAGELSELISAPVLRVERGYSPALTEAVVSLRERKSDEEVTEIEAALDVTAQMHRAAMRASRPGVVEREVVGIMEGITRRHDLQLAYPVIFSKRGEVLHNHGHALTLEKGDLVVNDAGCSSARGYASDVTRTLPIGGKLAGVQRCLYEIVLDAHQRTVAALRPGMKFIAAHKLACRVMVEGLKTLGCFRGDTEAVVEEGAYAVFFQCGVGHQLGLDVHDMEALGEDAVGYDESTARSVLFGLEHLRLAKPVQAGFVVTVEPGIYIIPALLDLWRSEKRYGGLINYEAFDRLRGIGGIRIEDDVLVTDAGSRVLGPHIARTPDELEAAMAQ